MKLVATILTAFAVACWFGVGWHSGFSREWLQDSFFGSGCLSIIAWMAHAATTNDEAGEQ